MQQGANSAIAPAMTAATTEPPKKMPLSTATIGTIEHVDDLVGSEPVVLHEVLAQAFVGVPAPARAAAVAFLVRPRHCIVEDGLLDTREHDRLVERQESFGQHGRNVVGIVWDLWD